MRLRRSKLGSWLFSASLIWDRNPDSFVHSRIFRMHTAANVADLSGQSQSFGSLTIGREWKWTRPHSCGTYRSAPSLHNVTAICFHSLAKCAELTTIELWHSKSFLERNRNDILRWQEILDNPPPDSSLQVDRVSSVLRKKKSSSCQINKMDFVGNLKKTRYNWALTRTHTACPYATYTMVP